MISVFDYQHYREYLKEYYFDQKHRKTGLTYARFSIAAGIRSPNYFKLILDGSKNLTSEMTVRFSKALSLKEQEIDYFEALVNFNQAKTPLQREFFEERLLRVKSQGPGARSQEKVLSEQEFEAVSDWKHHAVMVMTNLRGFREKLPWIRERLFHLASEQEVAAILERLQTLGLLKRREDGKLKQTHRQLRSKPELGRVLARAFYEGLLARASQGLKLSEPNEREFSAYLVGVSPPQVPELKRKVRAFMKQLNEWALENPHPEQVYALNFAAFPLTTTTTTQERPIR